MRQLALIFVCAVAGLLTPAFSQVMDPSDPVISYDENNPPSIPPNNGQVHDWVRTDRLGWDTDSYKAYYYNGMAFRLKFPNNYDASGNTKYPMIIMLHGLGERGEIFDNEYSMRHGGQKHRDAVNSGAFDGFVMYPQNTQGTWGGNYRGILNSLIVNHFEDINVDRNRIGIHGLSAGATGTWYAIYEYPKTFAAAAPMSGSPRLYEEANVFKHIPIWLSQGGRDSRPSPSRTQQLVDATWAVGSNLRYTLYENLGHGVWNTHYNENDFFPFFMRANKTNPAVLEGESVLVFNENNKQVYEWFRKVEFCPGENIYTRLAVTSGFDNYQWRKDGQLIQGANSNELVVTELGIYEARFMRDGEWTYWSPTPVVVSEKAVTQTPPIEATGLASVVLPSPDGNNTVQLEVPAGYIEYSWREVGTSQILSSSRTLIAGPGEYEVTVTEQFGCSSNYSVPFSVVDANGTNPPEAVLNFSGFALSNTSIQLQWSQNPNPTFNETAFEIYRKAPNEEYELIDITEGDASSLTDIDLQANTSYSYLIRAINENGASGNIETTIKTLVDAIPPSPPTNVRATATSGNSVTLAWDAATDDVGVEKYQIFRNGSLSTITSDTQTTLFSLNSEEVYRFYVKAVDFTGNLSPASEQIVVATVANGLFYSYYEGSWNNLPDFNSLTPEKNGKSDNVDISIRDQNDNFAFKWEGFISIPVAGSYTFETRSDDGSKLYIGGYEESNLVVNNDGLHGSRYREGTYNFPSPGSYPIVITFFEKGGGENMQVFWKNTAHGVSNRQQIPDEAFREDFEWPGEAPEAPSNINATSVSFSEIDITWSDNSNNETGFQLYRSSEDGEFLPIAIVEADIINYTDTDLQPETTYYYHVAALGEYGTSLIASGAPAAAIFKLNNNYIDDSGNGVNLNAVNDPMFSTEAKEGSHSISFDGDWADVDPGNQFVHDEFTERSVAFWMNNADLNGIQDIFDEGGSTNGIGLRLNGSTLEVGAQDNHDIQIVSAPFTTTDEWRHVAFVFDNGNLQLYIDGNLSSSSILPYNTVSSHGNGGGIGGTNGSNAFDVVSPRFEGLIDEFYVFTSAITETDLQAIIQASQMQNFATTLPLPALPDNPTDLVITATSISEVSLSWTDASSNEDGFKLYRSLGDDQNYFLIDTVSSGATILEYQDENLLPHTTYFYKVVPYNVAGNSSGTSGSTETLNTNPYMTPTFDFLSVGYGSQYEVQLLGEDEDGDNINFMGSNLPDFVQLTDYSDGTALLLFDAEASDEGVYEDLIIEISDNFGGSTSYSFDININNNQPPSIDPVTDIEIDEGAEQTIQLVGNDVDGIEGLEWTLESDFTFISIMPNLDGTAELKLAPTYDDAGSYEVAIKLADELGAFDTETFIITVGQVDPNTIVLFNFSKNSNAASPWNNTAKDPVNGDHFQGLLDTKGQSTTYGVLVNSTFGWNAAAFGAQTGNNSGFVPDVVAEEYWWFGDFGIPETVSLQLTGLDSEKAYEIQIFASSVWRGPADNGSTIYTIGSTSKALDVEGNTNDFVEFTGLSPQSNGTINITLSEDNDAQVGYINGFVLTEIYDDGNPPRAPTLTSVELTTESDATIIWNDESFNDSGFEVYRSTDGGSIYESIGTAEGGSTQFIDTNIPENATLTYAVKSFNNSGYSDYSNALELEVDAVPPVFSGLSEEYFVDAGSAKTIEISATDQLSISFDFDNLPAFVTATDNNDGTAELSVNASVEEIGIYENIQVTATDALGAAVTEYFSISITDPRISSISFNFSLNSEAADPWNNLGRNPGPFDQFTNLYNNKGDLTNIQIDYNTHYQGEIINEGATTGNNSGIVPDDVLSEYLWFGDFGAPQTLDFTVTNLNPQKIYNLAFVGSSVWSGVVNNGTTVFTVGGQSVSVNVQGNTEDIATLNGLQPDGNNEIKFTVSKGANTQVGYINGLVIYEYENSYIPAPSNLKVTAISATALKLNWSDNSGNETAYEVYEGTDSGNLSLLTTLNADITSYTHESLAKGSTHYYQVRAINLEGESEYTDIVHGTTDEFAVLVNLNNTSNQAVPNQNAAYPWNNFDNIPNENVDLVNLINTDGVSTGINFTVTSDFAGDFPDGQTTGDNSGIFPDNALITHFYVFPDADASVRISNLLLNYSYSVEIIGTWQSNCTTEYTINEQSFSLNNYLNVSNTVKFDNLTPDDFGNIDLIVSAAGGSPAGVINALKITAREDVKASSARLASYEISENPEMLNSFKIYPNPVKNENITISLKSATKTQTVIRLVDLLGNILIEKTHEVKLGINNDIIIETNNLREGIYLIQVDGQDFDRGFRKLIVR